MSDIDNRKSMDDVLASIRRIVRSEKEPEDVSDADVTATTTGTEAQDNTDDGDMPLELTPDMRMDPDQTDTAADASPSTEIDEMPSEETLKSMIRDVLVEEMAGDQMGDYVRSVIRDELVNGEIGSNISQNVMTLIQTEVASAMGR